MESWENYAFGVSGYLEKEPKLLMLYVKDNIVFISEFDDGMELIVQLVTSNCMIVCKGTMEYILS